MYGYICIYIFMYLYTYTYIEAEKSSAAQELNGPRTARPTSRRAATEFITFPYHVDGP